MGRTAGRITVDVVAGTAQLAVDIEKAKTKIREFGTAGVSESKAMRASIKALEGGFANNTRAAEAFASKLLGLGGLAQAAFPLVGAAAFGGLIFEIGEKMADFVKGLKDMPEKVESAFRGLVNPIKLGNDELRVTNDRIFDEIAKLEGHRQNGLKSMLDEAVVSADKLAEKLEKILSDSEKVLKENQVGWFNEHIMGVGGDSDITDQAHGSAARIAKRNDEMVEEMRKAAKEGNSDAQVAAEIIGKYGLQKEFKEQLAWVDAEVAKAQYAAKPHHQNMSMFATEAKDETARLRQLEEYRKVLEQGQEVMGLMSENEALMKRKEILTRDQIEPFKYKLNENALTSKLIRTGDPDHPFDYELGYRKMGRLGKIDYGDFSRYGFGAGPHPSLGGPVEGGVIGLDPVAVERHQAFDIAMIRMRMSRMSTEDQLKQLDVLKQKGIDGFELEKERQQILQGTYRTSAQVAIEAIDKINQKLLASGRASDGFRAFFNDMQKQGQRVETTIYEALHSALDRASGEFANFFIGKKTNWGAAFQGIGEQMVQGTVKNAMQKGLGKLGSMLGFGDALVKHDGSSESGFLYVKDVNGGVGGFLSGFSGDGSEGDSAGKSIWGSILGALIPHAGGGDVSPSRAYLVGERGPEILTGISGRITNSADSMRQISVGGPNVYYSIDARGTDPALVEQRVKTAIVAAHGSAIATSIMAQQEIRKRTPGR